MVERFRKGGQAAGDQAGRLSNQALDLGAKYGSDALARVASQAEERPLLTLGVALGIGILTSLFTAFTLTRLIDKLCDNGWIERRGDETDRRVNRLYLKKAARPLLGKLAGLRSELTATALDGINPADAHRLLAQLEAIKENVRNATQTGESDVPRKEQRYG